MQTDIIMVSVNVSVQTEVETPRSTEGNNVKLSLIKNQNVNGLTANNGHKTEEDKTRIHK